MRRNDNSGQETSRFEHQGRRNNGRKGQQESSRPQRRKVRGRDLPGDNSPWHILAATPRYTPIRLSELACSCSCSFSSSSSSSISFSFSCSYTCQGIDSSPTLLNHLLCIFRCRFPSTSSTSSCSSLLLLPPLPNTSGMTLRHKPIIP